MSQEDYFAAHKAGRDSMLDEIAEMYDNSMDEEEFYENVGNLLQKHGII